MRGEDNAKQVVLMVCRNAACGDGCGVGDAAKDARRTNCAELRDCLKETIGDG